MDSVLVCALDRARPSSPAAAAKAASVYRLDFEQGRCLLADQRLSREQRLRRRVDFLRCYRQGRKKHGSLASLHFHPNSLDDPRLGITASRKVGNSVVRHRIKRRVREVFRCYARRDELASLDVVVHLKPQSSRADFQDLESELEKLFGRLPTSPRVRE